MKPQIRKTQLVLTLAVLLAAAPLFAFLGGGKLPPFDGAEDASFFSPAGRDPTNANHGFDDRVDTIVYHPGTNSLLIGGKFTKYGGVAVPRLVKLSLDGVLDTTFNTNLSTGFANPLGAGEVFSIAVDGNGKIVVGGYFEDAGGNAALDYIARLNADGTYDPSFSPVNLLGNVKSIAIDPANNIVFGCNCYDSGDPTYTQLMRLNAADGSLDTTFKQTVIVNDGSQQVNGIGLLSDGSIIAVGNFLISGSTPKNMMKFSTTGSVDATFYSNVGTGVTNYPLGMLVQSDDKIVVVGSFSNAGVCPASRIFRVNADGTCDTGWATVSLPPIGQGFVAALDPQNRIFLAGQNFGTMSGIGGYEMLRRYSSAGVPDLLFNVGAGLAPATTTVVQTVLYHAGYLYIGGDFTSYNGKDVPRIVKVWVGL